MLAVGALAAALSLVPPPASARAEVEWIDVPSGESTLRAAVARPDQETPAPLVVVLHARSGFRPSFVSLAEQFADAGFVAIAGCWFGGSGDEPPPADLIDCPNAPAFMGANLNSIEAVRALIAAGRELPGVRSDRVGLFGHSIGATASLLVASTTRDASAVVASAPHTTEPASLKPPNPALITLVDDLAAPVLLLHGTADEVIPVQQTRDYEQALRQAGKPVESHYYDGATHNTPFLPETAADVFQRSSLFLDERLRAPDLAPPELSLEVSAGQKLGTVASKGLKVTAGCSEACSIELALAKGESTLGAGSGELAAAGETKVVVKLTRAGKKRLSDMRKARLTLNGEATDAAGNVGTALEKLTLKR